MNEDKWLNFLFVTLVICGAVLAIAITVGIAAGILSLVF